MTQDNNLASGTYIIYSYSSFAILSYLHIEISNDFQDALTGVATTYSLKLSL